MRYFGDGIAQALNEYFHFIHPHFIAIDAVVRTLETGPYPCVRASYNNICVLHMYAM